VPQKLGRRGKKHWGGEINHHFSMGGGGGGNPLNQGPGPAMVRRCLLKAKPKATIKKKAAEKHACSTLLGGEGQPLRERRTGKLQLLGGEDDTQTGENTYLFRRRERKAEKKYELYPNQTTRGEGKKSEAYPLKNASTARPTIRWGDCVPEEKRGGE